MVAKTESFINMLIVARNLSVGMPREVLRDGGILSYPKAQKRLSYILFEVVVRVIVLSRYSVAKIFARLLDVACVWKIAATRRYQRIRACLVKEIRDTQNFLSGQ